MAKTCANCIYKDRKWGDNPCRTCMESGSDVHENWTGIDDEEKLDLIGCGVNIGSRWSKQNTIAELEKIKEEIQGLIDFEESCCCNTTLGYSCLRVINEHIAELKGDKCDNDHDCEHCDWVECPLDKENKE